MRSVFLSLGSNLGDRYSYLQFARRAIEFRMGKVIAVSSVYESAPWGFDSDNFFYNQVLQLQCNVDVYALLAILQQIEREAGRERILTRYADRTLDIDILFYDNEVIVSPELTVPHPHIPERRFVLEPLCELAPEHIHPVLQLSLHRLLEDCKDPCVVRQIKI